MRRFFVYLLAAGSLVRAASPQLMAQQTAGETQSATTAPAPGQLVPGQPAPGQPATGQPQLKKLPVPAARAREIATQLSLRYRDLPGITISPDPQNDQLVVLAPEEAQERIAGDVRALVQTQVRQAMSTEPGAMTMHLRSISWREFEDGLQQIAGRSLPVTTSRNGERAAFQLNGAMLKGTLVEVDRRNNSVTISAPPAKQAGWQTLVAAIDQPAPARGQVAEVLRVEKAEPAPIQRAIRLLRELEESQAKKTRRAPLFRDAAFQPPQDAPPADAADPPADADEGEAGPGVIRDLDFQFVPELGVIIVKGARQDVDRVRALIAEIELQSELTRPQIEVRRLEHTDSNAVAELLEQLYEDVLSARQGEVSITALDTPNALLLIGREEAIKTVLELVQKLDEPIADTDRLRVFRLQHASALDAETTIRDFFTDRPGTGDEVRPGIGIRVRVIADYRTNSLIVSASPRDMMEVTRLVNQIDVQEVTARNELKIFPLNNARAEDLAPIIQSAITGDGEAGENPNATRPSTTLSIVATDPDGDQTLDSGILAGVVVTADNNANALVVRGPASSMPLIAELIRQLDRAPGIESLVKVFTIQNGDAGQLTVALQDLFGAAAAGGAAQAGPGLATLPISTAAESSLVPLRFTTDIRSNSIIASGSVADLEVVESILLRLDSEGFAERITEVIWLRHQIAENVAAAIDTYVGQRITGQNIIRQFQQGLGPYDLVDRDLIVVPEGQTNSLVLSVSPRLYQEVRRLIDQLDRRPPMVLIKVLIAEVNLDDRFEIGGELGLQDSLLFDRGIASLAPDDSTLENPFNNPGFNFNNAGTPNLNTVGRNSLATRGVSTFGVGRLSSEVNFGGFVLNAASESISMLFRTLQRSGRLQVLSRPEVMVMDNNEAFLQVGQRVARPQNVSVVLQQTIIGIEDIDVGLILRVTPRVGADGLIVMAIDATRSQINTVARGQSIGSTATGQDIEVQPIDITTAQSTISAYSGQTVVFGGLIQKERINTSRRVPYLADIPLLGYMFKFDVETERRSELLIVMTPMLVTGEQDLEYVKETESSRMSWCLADVVEAHGDVGLSGGYGLWGPAIGPTIYPHLQPTVDDVINGHRMKRRDSILFDESIEVLDSPEVIESPQGLESPAAGGSAPADGEPGSPALPVPAPTDRSGVGSGMGSLPGMPGSGPVPARTATGNPPSGPGGSVIEALGGGQPTGSGFSTGAAIPAAAKPAEPFTPPFEFDFNEPVQSQPRASVRQSSYDGVATSAPEQPDLPAIDADGAASSEPTTSARWGSFSGAGIKAAGAGPAPSATVATRSAAATTAAVPQRLGVSPGNDPREATGLVRPTAGDIDATRPAAYPSVSPRSWIR